MFAPLTIYSAAFAGWRVEITAEEITGVTFLWWRKTVRRAEIAGVGDEDGLENVQSTYLVLRREARECAMVGVVVDYRECQAVELSATLGCEFCRDISSLASRSVS
jgi:hypothetical protein